MGFEFRQTIGFKHCDPAGIVFYPRYFEMFNDCVEAFFDRGLGWDFATLHKEFAIPTAEITTQFQRPLRLGEVLELGLSVTKIGRTSMGLLFDGAPNLRAQSSVVLVDLMGKPTPWPDEIRPRLQEFMEGVSQ